MLELMLSLGMDFTDGKSGSARLHNLRKVLTSRKKIEYLIVALVALVIFDGIITEFLVGNDLGEEGNPFLKGLVGEWSFMVIKVAGALLCAFLLWDIHRRWARLGIIGTWCLIGCYSAIVAWNIIVCFITI